MNLVKGFRWLWCWAFLTCVLSATASTSGWAQEPQFDVLLFDSYEGTFISASKSTLKIRTADGDKDFQLAKPSDDLPQLGVGRGTAISVSGVDRISFLKSSMTIRFVAELDKTGSTSKPLELIEVLAISDKMDTLRERISDLDPQTGLASYRFTARIQSIDQQTKRLGVLIRPSNKSERFEFALDPENTRVSYDLPNLSLAQPGEEILVRCLSIPGDNQVASEVRVTRPSPFPADAPRGAVDPMPNPNQPLGNEVLVDPAEPKTTDDESGMEGDRPEDLKAGDTQETDVESNDAEPPDDVVEFDFDAPLPGEPTIDRGLQSDSLDADVPESKPEAVEVPVAPKQFEDRSARRGNSVRRGWYKIN